MKRLFVGMLLMGAVAGCDTRAPAPPRPEAAKVEVSINLKGDPVDGSHLYRAKQCAACHGPTALGGIGKQLAQTDLTFKQFLLKIRNAMPPKPAMNENDLSESQAYSIYLWLHTTDTEPAGKAEAQKPRVPAGQILGIQIWSERGCGKCHGAFAQGSQNAPALAGQNYPFERQRALMRRSAGQNQAHADKSIPDGLLKRLLDWLRRGADPASGC